ncbi:MAG: hypothetical protein C5B50_17070 [Verrucomicrobia bacterium]|nr:MAG: hypothetical protein C5B50_17070 [Verrucomicrobiota bacterium]
MVFGVCLSGCSSIGPHTVARDRFDYSSAVADSWKEQTLLNIVKLRYIDLPVFLDVGQIVSGYSLQTGVSINGTVSAKNAVQGNYIAAGGSAIYTDRPTITYSPLTGDKFLRGLLEPIPPQSIFYMIQSGYAADFVLGLSVEAMNGLRNFNISTAGQRTADPEFVRVVRLVRELQLSDSVGLRVEKATNNLPATFFFFRKQNTEPEVQKQIDEVKKLLGVEPEEDRLRLIYSPVRSAPGELAVQTRSVLQILLALASFIEVPAEQINEHRAAPTPNTPSEEWPIRVKFSKTKPADCYATVPYRGGWYWIDDRDLKSKRAFGFVMFVFTLADTGKVETPPLITIPAQ